MHGVDNGVVSLQDELTGQTLAVKPKVVVNAAGPWIDFANDRFAEKTRFIGGTKGSHLVIDNPALHAATQGHELFFENTDGRICLFFPLQDKVLVGTTDIPIEDPDDAICTDDEITYMLEMIRIVFPSIPVERSQIVFTFSGVRPLPATDAANPGQISRDHKIEVTQPGNGANFPVYSLIGGKWTTFRAFGEQVADKILRHLGQSREVDTHDMAIGGGRQYPQTGPDQMIWVKKLHAATGLPEERLRILFDRYGTYAEDVAAFLAAGEDSPLAAMPDYSRREIEFLATYEHIAHLDDLLLRRSLLAMLGYASHELIEEIAPIVGQVLDWSAEEMPVEIERTVQLLRSRHRIAE
ncbi:MAG: FAD-dependent oxidoreductase [Chloroflexi bacterium]|nr:FAD-dependent oxidoreductase [Chloroflexota bacterium]